MINLLSNAIKFSNANEQIEVSIFTANKPELEGRKLELILEVSDTGVGMSHNDLKHLFKPFYFATEASNLERNRQGHGLGLSICDKIIKAMGGSIEVTSELGVGTKFTIKLVTEIEYEKPPLLMVKLSTYITQFLGKKIKNAFTETQRETR